MARKLFKLLENWSDLIPAIICCAFTAGALWTSMSNSMAQNNERITKLEKHDKRGAATLTWMGSNIVLIMRQLHIEPLPKPDEPDDK